MYEEEKVYSKEVIRPVLIECNRFVFKMLCI